MPPPDRDNDNIDDDDDDAIEDMMLNICMDDDDGIVRTPPPPPPVVQAIPPATEDVVVANIVPGAAAAAATAQPNNEEEPNDLYVSVDVLNGINTSNLPPHDLRLKVGAVVMLLRYIDLGNGQCNGCRLLVRRMQDQLLELETLTGPSKGKIVWLPRMVLRSTVPELISPIQRTQFPVRLAFAMTVNKSQGHTFKRVGIALTSPCFAHVQLYVAMSRAGDPAQVRIFVGPHPMQGRFTFPATVLTTRNVVHREVFTVRPDPPVVVYNIRKRAHQNVNAAVVIGPDGGDVVDGAGGNDRAPPRLLSLPQQLLLPHYPLDTAVLRVDGTRRIGNQTSVNYDRDALLMPPPITLPPRARRPRKKRRNDDEPETYLAPSSQAGTHKSTASKIRILSDVQIRPPRGSSPQPGSNKEPKPTVTPGKIIEDSDGGELSEAHLVQITKEQFFNPICPDLTDVELKMRKPRT